MAKLVSVIRSDEYLFERRQLPLSCDDKLTLVMQLDDSCMVCSKESLKRKDLERFVQKFHALSSDELAVALLVSSKDILSLLQQMVPCVGCRRSVERLLKQLQNSSHPALDPLIVTRSGSLSIKRECLFDPRAVFALFYIHGCKMVDVMESIPKSKKNKRCNLHSLDTHTHKTRTLGIWEEAWRLLSPECREEVVIIEFDALMKTLDSYLRKHRFCSECKSKVLRAYNILIQEVESKNEKGYVAALFEGLRCCKPGKHVHVSTNTDYISLLITRAEPELTGRYGRRERHAKTLDIAQEEVLTCLGIHLYERLYKIHQKLKAEEQTWQILLYLGMDALRKSFDVALENKQGRSNLELMCEELLQEEQAKEQKRELKRQKKKKKKNTKSASPTIDKKGSTSPASSKLQLDALTAEKCKCDENTNIESAPCNSCDENHAPVSPLNNRCAFQSPSAKSRNGCSDNLNSCDNDAMSSRCHSSPPNNHNLACAITSLSNGGLTSLSIGKTTCSPCKTCLNANNTDGGFSPCKVCDSSATGSSGRRACVPTISCSGAALTCSSSLTSHSQGHHPCGGGGGSGGGLGPDVGYSSGHEGGCSEHSNNTSSASSRDGSDVACQEGYCNHDGDSVLCQKPEVTWCRQDTSISSSGACDEATCGKATICDVAKSCDDSTCRISAVCDDTTCDGVCEVAGCGDGGGRGGGWRSGGWASGHKSSLGFSLQDMLEEACCSGEEEEEGVGISEEEIQQFQANQQRVRDQRDRLRQVLRQRFANMQTRLQCQCVADGEDVEKHVCPQ